jgi:enhancing lycopene biosynthesis protein 2
MKKVAVILSGSGVFDGAEIHEAVLTLLALDRRNAQVEIVAPDIQQMQVIDHFSGKTMLENRNVFTEAARIARGKIKNLTDVSPEQYDALIFPGGFGVAKNFSDFATRGVDCEVNPLIEKFIVDGIRAKKAMGFMCIAPVLLAKVTENMGLQLKVTIGTDDATAKAVSKMNARHVNCPANDIVVDEANQMVTTPAYMLGTNIHEVFAGIDKLVEKVLELAGN